MKTLPEQQGLEFLPGVVIPTFNHGSTLGAVLEGVGRNRILIVVVDDGSEDGTSEVIAGWVRRNPGSRLVLRRHARNRGKGAALGTGFGAAAELGVTHAVTFDADNQLSSDDIPRLISAARARPGALVLGRRPSSMERCPRRCAYGRIMASLAVRLQTGLRISDTQCGLRVYPLKLVTSVKCMGGGYTYESEIITRAAWRGVEVIEVPVECRYFPAAERVSHFRPLVDTLRQASVHLWLIGKAIIPGSRRASALAGAG